LQSVKPAIAPTDQIKGNIMRRQFLNNAVSTAIAAKVSCLGLGAGLLSLSSLAQAQLTEIDAVKGLRAALDQGATKAVANLGTNDGFLKNAKVRIPLPSSLKKVKSAAKLLGMDKQFDELEVSMNRAAENAVPKAKPLLVNAIKQMSVQDAMGILKGGDDSVTNYFKSKTEAKLIGEFLPFASEATAKVGLAQQYNALASKGASLGLVKEDQKSLDGYIAQKAVDGLFYMIGQEEKALRANPLGASSDILKKVFGMLK
jgi:Protein of unknown function (DUF4197)